MCQNALFYSHFMCTLFWVTKTKLPLFCFFEYCLFRSNRNIIKIHSELSSDEAEKMLSPRCAHRTNLFDLFIKSISNKSQKRRIAFSHKISTSLFLAMKRKICFRQELHDVHIGPTRLILFIKSISNNSCKR